VRHFDFDGGSFGPNRVGRFEIEVGPSHFDRSAEVANRRSHAGPLGWGFRERCGDAIGNRIGDLVDDGAASEKLDVAGGSALKDFLGPLSVTLESIRESSIALLDESRKIAVNVRQHLMNVSGEHLHGVKNNAELLCEHRGGVPIESLRCAIFVWAKQEVATCRSASNKPGAAGDDFARSGHSPHKSG